jgi:hypothetical protein
MQFNFKVSAMNNHYNMMLGEQIVGVVTPCGKNSWQVDTLIGRVKGVSSWIPLHDALKVAYSWEP